MTASQVACVQGTLALTKNRGLERLSNLYYLHDYQSHVHQNLGFENVRRHFTQKVQMFQEHNLPRSRPVKREESPWEPRSERIKLLRNQMTLHKLKTYPENYRDH